MPDLGAVTGRQHEDLALVAAGGYEDAHDVLVGAVAVHAMFTQQLASYSAEEFVEHVLIGRFASPAEAVIILHIRYDLDPTRPHFGFRLVERLNVAAIGGFPLGIAAMFWANRLLPVAMKGRGEWEVHVLFLAWLAALLLALVRRPQIAWTILFGTAGALLATIPFYNLVATRQGLIATIARGDWLMAGIDLTILMFGIGFAAIAVRVARYRPAQRKPRRKMAERVAAILEPAE